MNNSCIEGLSFCTQFAQIEKFVGAEPETCLRLSDSHGAFTLSRLD